MASLQKKGNGWYCQFLHHGKRPTLTIGSVPDEEARAKAAQVDYLLLRLKQRLIELPLGVGIVEFVRHDGRPSTDDPAKANMGVLTALRRLPVARLPAHEPARRSGRQAGQRRGGYPGRGRQRADSQGRVKV